MNHVQDVTILAVIGIVVLVLCLYVLRRYANRIQPDYFRRKWLAVQRLCANRQTWPLAVLNADKLLDEALKKKRKKGKSMGERLAAAQHDLTNNDGVWYAHNLAKKLADKTNLKLREADIKKALVAVRQALRDLGALDDK